MPKVLYLLTIFLWVTAHVRTAVQRVIARTVRVLAVESSSICPSFLRGGLKFYYEKISLSCFSTFLYRGFHDTILPCFRV